MHVHMYEYVFGVSIRIVIFFNFYFHSFAFFFINRCLNFQREMCLAIALPENVREYALSQHRTCKHIQLYICESLRFHRGPHLNDLYFCESTQLLTLKNHMYEHICIYIVL